MLYLQEFTSVEHFISELIEYIEWEELAEEWFEDYAKPNLRSTTYERMLQLRHRVYPAIGHLRIDKITVRQLQAFVNSLAKEGTNEKTGKPLAPKTIRHNLSFISDVFSYAVRMELISDNPCSKVVIPKGEVKEKQIYSQEEMELLLTKLMDEPVKYRALFFLIAYSGFRRSEMLGLEWKDIDFENNICENLVDMLTQVFVHKIVYRHVARRRVVLQPPHIPYVCLAIFFNVPY